MAKTGLLNIGFFDGIALNLARSLCLMGTIAPAFAQLSSFRNLSFDIGRIPADAGAVAVATGFPGWTVLVNNAPQEFIVRNGVSLGGSMVSFYDTSAFTPAIAGRYSMFLVGLADSIPFEPFFREGSAAIYQVGTIPGDARSLLFSANQLFGLEVSVLGQNLSYFEKENHGSYSIYAADISPYAGQTGELRFTAPYLKGAMIDSIQFSPSVVPEPSTVVLLAVGSGVLVFRKLFPPRQPR